MPHTEGVGGGLSGYKYVHSYTTHRHHALPSQAILQAHSAAVHTELLSPPRSDHTHAALLRSRHCVVQHGPIQADPPAK